MKIMVCYNIGMNGGTASIDGDSILSVDSVTEDSLNLIRDRLIQYAKDDPKFSGYKIGNCVFRSVVHLEG